ncbi:MAG: FAD:protein FMN transferase [Parvularculaceae bacterium]
MSGIDGNPNGATLEQAGDCFVYRFSAMASPCEVRIETGNCDAARRLGRIAEKEARRIEEKYSRYRSDSVVSQINGSNGAEFVVDAETARLIDYADHCYGLSNGQFDITSGVLRRVWKFDGSDRIPSPVDVNNIRKFVGWEKALWRSPAIILPEGMEIDFGGIGKEYAVDRVVSLLKEASAPAFLVNFGGDLRASGPRSNGELWRVAIESVMTPGAREGLLVIGAMALTTSGDARRYLLKDGVRYGHILDPRTGWPVKDPPRSVTVAAPTCTEAGLLSTLAMLLGQGAEAFLKAEGVRAWVLR